MKTTLSILFSSRMSAQTENSIGSAKPLSGFLLVVMLISALSLQSCKSRAMVSATTTTRTETVYLRDTVVRVADADSASIRALLRCDSLNNILVDSLLQRDGSRIVPTVRLLRQQNGALGIDFVCKEDSLMAVVQHQERVIKELNENTHIVEIDKPLNGWQKIVMGAGYALIGIVVVGFIVLCIKIFT